MSLETGKQNDILLALEKVHDFFIQYAMFFFFFFFFYFRGCPGQLARTSTNPTGPEVNDHVSLQWPSYERPQGSNLRPKREQTP